VKTQQNTPLSPSTRSKKPPQNRQRSSGFPGSRCRVPFPILVSPLWSLSTAEPEGLATAGQLLRECWKGRVGNGLDKHWKREEEAGSLRLDALGGDQKLPVAR